MKGLPFLCPLFALPVLLVYGAAHGQPPAGERQAVSSAAAPGYLMDVELNKMERGSGKDGHYPWNEASAYCLKAGARLPTAAELRRIYGTECSDGNRGDTCRRWYWSSDEDGGAMAFGMRFFDGDMHSGSKYSTASGMMCLRDWAAAAAYCRSIGKRLPAVKEVRRIYAAECGKGKRSGYCGFWYWTSEEAGADSALGVSFVSGSPRKMPKNSGNSAVICVPLKAGR